MSNISGADSACNLTLSPLAPTPGTWVRAHGNKGDRIPKGTLGIVQAKTTASGLQGGMQRSGLVIWWQAPCFVEFAYSGGEEVPGVVFDISEAPAQ